MKIIFKTERLLLREFENSDFKFVIELVNMPSWLRFIGNRNIHTQQAAENYIENLQRSYFENGFGFWLVELKSDKTPIGLCGLVKRKDLELPDIGFAFLPFYEGAGFATEAALATLDVAKLNLKLDKICAITKKENSRSIHLLEKIGFHFEENIQYNDEELMFFINSFE